jgi:replication fork protection complex subunit Csm3/Swi3
MLLGTYQLWLDALYPRSKFADGLAMIEKLGHQKNLQRSRYEWINDSKPKEDQTNESSDGNISVAEADTGTAAPGVSPRQENEPPTSAEGEATGQSVPTERREHAITTGTSEPVSEMPASGPPDDDELDQLLAEEAEFSHLGPEARNSFTTEAVAVASKAKGFDEDDFATEEDIMRELEFFG